MSNLLRERSNWGRWGDDDELGAINLVSAEKRLQAIRTVRSGRLVSMSRPVPTEPEAANPLPAHHYMRTHRLAGGGGAATDYLAISYHGRVCTHLDALCHMWPSEGMWNGRDPAVEVTTQGSAWAGVDSWSEGIVTRALLFDVPHFRGEEYVASGRPVHGWELEAIAEQRKFELTGGDALVVYCGRDRYEAVHGTWGLEGDHPGLDASCLEFIRESDCAVLAWDMLDVSPSGYERRIGVHDAIGSFGIALVDNCELGGVVRACAAEERDEFLLMIAPLLLRGGTGSPVNPLAMF